MTAVAAKDISLKYDKKEVVRGFSADFAQGKIISIIGPNGSGKSTILRSFARLLNTARGQISLFDTDIATVSKKEFAKRLAILLQHNISPEDITVKNLIYFGRCPHKKWYQQFEKEDEVILQKKKCVCCQEESGSGCGWQWLWHSNRKCSYWMSRLPIWTSAISLNFWILSMI